MSAFCDWCHKAGHLGIHCDGRPGGPKPHTQALYTSRGAWGHVYPIDDAKDRIAAARAEGIADGLRMARDEARRGAASVREHDLRKALSGFASWCEQRAKEVER